MADHSPCWWGTAGLLRPFTRFRNGPKLPLQLIVVQAFFSLSGELVEWSFPVTFRLDTHHATESPPFLSVLRKPCHSLLMDSLENLIGYPWDPRDSRQIPRKRVAQNSAQFSHKTRSIHLALAVSMLRPFSWKRRIVAPVEPLTLDACPRFLYKAMIIFSSYYSTSLFSCIFRN